MAAVKKLINDPQTVVAESLEGFGAAHAGRGRRAQRPVVRHAGRRRGDRARSGWSAAAAAGTSRCTAGFVGVGMLDAAVPGAVFTSPTPDQIAPAIQAADAGAGVLAIVKNYTGDVLNFETAAELADAEGITVADRRRQRRRRRRGLALHRGPPRGGRHGRRREDRRAPPPSAGDDLDAVAAVAEKVIANVRSMGVALTACTVPHAGKPSFDLPDDEIEIGIGIHGEPGRRRIPLAGADEITEMLLTPVADDLGLDRRREGAAVRQRHGRHPGLRALRGLSSGPRVARGARGRRCPARSSATT